MPEIRIQIENLPQIRAAFDRAPANMARHLDVAIRLSLLTIGKQAMINSPVLTGRMRASILSEGLQIGQLSGSVGPTVNYAIYVHEGTRFMAARPFLRDAVDSTNDEVQKMFVDAVTETLQDIANESS